MLLYGHDDTFLPTSVHLATNALYACKECANKDFMWHDYKILEQYAKKACAPNFEQLFSERLKMVDANDEDKQEFTSAGILDISSMV